MRVTDLVAEARAADWDFTNWCCASGYDASDPDASRMFECLLAYARREGRARLELTGRSAAAVASLRTILACQQRTLANFVKNPGSPNFVEISDCSKNRSRSFACRRL